MIKHDGVPAKLTEQRRPVRWLEISPYGLGRVVRLVWILRRRHEDSSLVQVAKYIAQMKMDDV